MNYLDYAIGALCGLAAGAPVAMLCWKAATAELRADLKHARWEANEFMKAWQTEVCHRPVYDHAAVPLPTTEMCGGCGKYMTPLEIVACPGTDCANYVGGVERKINAGFNSFLQP